EIIKPNIDLNEFPIPVHHEKDAGPYITAVCWWPKILLPEFEIYQFTGCVFLIRINSGSSYFLGTCGIFSEWRKQQRNLWRWRLLSAWTRFCCLPPRPLPPSG